MAKTAGMRRNLWVENADRLIAGFLEMFEEGCHKMVGELFFRNLFTELAFLSGDFFLNIGRLRSIYRDKFFFVIIRGQKLGTESRSN